MNLPRNRPGLALCGTAPRADLLTELDRWQRLYAVLDTDTAGQAATARVAEAFGERVVPVLLPHGAKDPADLAKHPDGDALFAAAIQNAATRVPHGPTDVGTRHSNGRV